MSRAIVRLFACVAFFLATNCGGTGPLSPTPSPVPIPAPNIPDPSKYEPLGKVKRLLDDQGRDTGMWVKLTAVSPQPGSTIVYGTDVCPTQCFYYTAEAGMDEGIPQNLGAEITASLIKGDRVYTTLGGSIAVKSGSSGIMTARRFFEQFPPETLLIKGSRTMHGASDLVGWASFTLDYR